MHPLLDKIDYPRDFRNFDQKDLIELSAELRQKLIEVVSEIGGHLGAGLGVIELTIALHYVFNTPHDKLIWDVGHQTYPHKILTGRKDRIYSLRKEDGLSGFTKITESEYDCFGAGHSSTSISAALGMAVARDLEKKDYEIVAVIGDGAMSAGMAYEAINNAGHLNSKLTVILNDNDMSIAPAVGAMRNYLVNMISSRPYLNLRQITKKLSELFPDILKKTAQRAEQSLKNLTMGNNIFEALGFYYLGPIDGHDLDILIPLLKKIKDHDFKKPVLLHVITEKGRGYAPAKTAEEKYHGVVKFDIETGVQHKTTDEPPSYTKVFANQLIKEAEIDEKIVAITAAMPSGTGLDLFAKKFPTRCFDVGIAEQHAVTFAGGLAISGLKPFCAIYSTFLQRAYDQVIHDIAIQKLPVRFAIDRAGFVGSDGATHTGSFDIAFLSIIPNFILMAPSNNQELMQAVKTAVLIDDMPCGFRYPRGSGQDMVIADKILPFIIGKANLIQEGERVAIVSLGTILNNVLAASSILENKHKIKPTIIDARFIKPFDANLFAKIAKTHKYILSIEEGSCGGFSSILLEFLNKIGFFDAGNKKFNSIYIKDEFFEQASTESLYKKVGMDVENIVNTITNIIN